MEKIQPRSVSFQSSGVGVIDADQLAHRQVEYAERVGLPDAQMDAQRGRRNHPSAEAGLGDGVRAVEKAEKSRRGRGGVGAGHRAPSFRRPRLSAFVPRQSNRRSVFRALGAPMRQLQTSTSFPLPNARRAAIRAPAASRTPAQPAPSLFSAATAPAAIALRPARPESRRRRRFRESFSASRRA